ncbi:hypothetical protein QE152_g23377 [Popillia japonica]|uniref:Uncharacterized protein n=1 Tax=Popillia japonica TaxID=7064 RepID=A0AAW1KHP9_POPJA
MSIRKSDATNSELSSRDEADYIQSETYDTEDSEEESIINDENESVINMPRKKCIVLNSSDSDEETEIPFRRPKQQTKVVFLEGYHLCIFKGVKGPTGYTKRNIMADNLISAVSLIIDNI